MIPLIVIKVEKGNITVKGNATFDKSAQQIDLIALCFH